MTPAKFSKQFQSLQKWLSEEEPAQQIIRELEQRLIDHPESVLIAIAA